MDEQREIVELLREIRDTAKTHFARYQEFTDAMLRVSQEDLRYREETRQAMLRGEERQQEIRQEVARQRRLHVTGGVLAVLLLTLVIVRFLLEL